MSWNCPRCRNDNPTEMDFMGRPNRSQRCETCQLDVEVDFPPPVPPPRLGEATTNVEKAPEELTASDYLKGVRSQTQYGAARSIGKILAAGIGLIPVLMFLGRGIQNQSEQQDLGTFLLIAALLVGLALAIHQASAVVFDMADTLIDIGRKQKK